MGRPVRVQVPPTTPYKIMRLYASIILYSRSEGAEPQCEAFNGFSGFADGRHEVSPDSEEIEQTRTEGSIAKLSERKANPRQAVLSRSR